MIWLTTGGRMILGALRLLAQAAYTLFCCKGCR